MNEKMTFWQPKPQEPWKDWRMYTMLIPVMVSAVGLFIIEVFAYAENDLYVISAQALSRLVVIGSAMMVWGAELNTPFTTIEVFRKIRLKEADVLDYLALSASLLGTIINVLLALTKRMQIVANWTDWVYTFGPLLSVGMVALDYYGATVELSGLFSAFNVRYPQWLKAKSDWDEKHAQAEPDLVESLQISMRNLQTQVLHLQMPVATLQWFKKTCKTLARPQNTDVLKGIRDVCQSNGRRFAGEKRTAHTWADYMKG